MAYTPTGPFVNGSSPGISAAFLNSAETYLYSGVAGSGVPICSKFGPYTVTTTPTFQNHGLHDQNGASITPDLCILQIAGTSVGAHGVEFDAGTMTSTQVKLTSTDAGGITVYGVALKF